MAQRPRLAYATLVLGAVLVFSLLGIVSSGASVKAGGKVVSAKLTPKTSFTAAQANTVKLVCKFSPASKRATFQLSLKKSAKWVKVRNVTKKGNIKTSATTVKKLFGSKAVKVGQYRVKVSADANSLTRKFAVTAPAATAGTDSGSDGSGDEGDASGDEGSGSSSGSRGSGDCGADCDEDSGDEDSGDDGGSAPVAPAAFGKTSPVNGATGVPQSLTLSWSASSNVVSYQYCVDTTSICSTASVTAGWVKANSISATVGGLTSGKTYYWQVYAVGSPTGTWADGGTWFSFTVAP